MEAEFPDSKDKPEVLLARLQAKVPGLRLDEAVKKLANDRKAIDLVWAYTVPDLRPGVHAIFDLIETATPVAAAVLRLKMLVALFREAEDKAAPDHLDLPSAVIMTMGPQGPHQDALNRFAARRTNNQFSDAFEYVADRVVKTHCIEALPLLRGALAIEVTGPPLYTPIHALLNPFQIKSDVGPSPQARLRHTLEFMRSEGLDLNTAGLMHKAASLRGSCVDVLVVLLDLGLDPDVKDGWGHKPTKMVDDADERDRWDSVVHSFKARRTAHQLLEGLEPDPAPSPAMP